MLRSLLVAQMAWHAAAAAAAYEPGDCALVGYSAAKSNFAVMLLKPLPAGMQLFATNCGVRADGSLRTEQEGIAEFRSAAVTPVGTVLSRGNFSTATQRSIKLKRHDQLIVFVGSPAAPQYVCAVHSHQSGGELAWQRGATDDATSALPPGLENGKDALAIPRVEQSAAYDMQIKVGNQHSLRPLFVDAKRWVYNSEPLPTTADFSVMYHTPTGPGIYFLSWGLVALMMWAHHKRYIDLYTRPPPPEPEDGTDRPPRPEAPQTQGDYDKLD